MSALLLVAASLAGCSVQSSNHLGQSIATPDQFRFHDIDVKEAFHHVSKHTNVRYSIDPDVWGTIDIRAGEMPPFVLFFAIAARANASVVIGPNNELQIVPTARIKSKAVPLSPPHSAPASDWKEHDGSMYHIGSGFIYRLDLKSQKLTTAPLEPRQNDGISFRFEVPSEVRKAKDYLEKRGYYLWVAPGARGSQWISHESVFTAFVFPEPGKKVSWGHNYADARDPITDQIIMSISPFVNSVVVPSFLSFHNDRIFAFDGIRLFTLNTKSLDVLEIKLIKGPMLNPVTGPDDSPPN